MKSLLKVLNEDNPLLPVKAEQKQNWLFLASVMIGCTICVPVFYIGAQFAQQMAFQDFILAVFLGGVLVTGIAVLTGIVGQRTGLPTSMLTKVLFGHKGAMAINLAMAITATGWFGIQISVFSHAMVALMQQIYDVQLNLIVVMLVAGVLMASTAVIGYRGLGKLSYIATPLLLLLLVLPWGLYYLNGEMNGLWAFAPEGQLLSVGSVVAMVAGAYSFAATMPDMTRMMVSTKETIKGLVANFFVAYPLLLILTGSLAVAAQQADFMQIMIGLGFGGLALVVLFLSTWTTNDTNVYAGALAANPFIPQVARWKIAAAVGVLGTLAAIGGIFEHFMSWLIFTGNLFGPMAGVLVADYWLNQKRYHKLQGHPKFRWPQLVAWLAGLGVGLCTASADSMGFGLFSLTTVPVLDAMLTAALVQLVWHRLSK